MAWWFLAGDMKNCMTGHRLVKGGQAIKEWWGGTDDAGNEHWLNPYHYSPLIVRGRPRRII